MNKFLFPERKIREECGVFGVFNNDEAASLTALGLHALQHRGHDSSGIVTYSENNFLDIEDLDRLVKFLMIQLFYQNLRVKTLLVIIGMVLLERQH